MSFKSTKLLPSCFNMTSDQTWRRWSFHFMNSFIHSLVASNVINICFPLPALHSLMSFCFDPLSITRVWLCRCIGIFQEISKTSRNHPITNSWQPSLKGQKKNPRWHSYSTSSFHQIYFHLQTYRSCHVKVESSPEPSEIGFSFLSSCEQNANWMTHQNKIQKES